MIEKATLSHSNHLNLKETTLFLSIDSKNLHVMCFRSINEIKNLIEKI